MDAFEIAEIIAAREKSGERYLEFFRASTLSVGLYVLHASEPDPQRPHTEDEIYYVVSGRGKIRVANETRDVQPGSIIFVEAGVEHRFHDIAETLTILVVFAPPRGSQASA
ncbi:MAG: cupin domain-containing protein [Ardenticatenaceae bacterium]